MLIPYSYTRTIYKRPSYSRNRIHDAPKTSTIYRPFALGRKKPKYRRLVLHIP